MTDHQYLYDDNGDLVATTDFTRPEVPGVERGLAMRRMGYKVVHAVPIHPDLLDEATHFGSPFLGSKVALVAACGAVLSGWKVWMQATQNRCPRCVRLADFIAYDPSDYDGAQA